MILESYVSFETAKLLKEKGFNEYCRAFRSPSGKLFYSSKDIKNFEDKKTIGSAAVAPTLQMAMKLLREVHKLAIQTGYNYKGWFCTIDDISTQEADFKWESKFYNLYEEAVEAAIKYCLENLI